MNSGSGTKKRERRLAPRSPCAPLSRLSPDVQIRFLAHALESLRDAVYITDRRHTVIYANPAIFRIHGYHPRQVVGRKAGAYFEGIPGNPKNLARLIRREARNGFWVGRLLNRDRAGRVFSIQLIENTIRGPRGEVIGYLGISRDITEQRHLEEALREEKERLENLLDSIPDCVYFKDARGRYLLVNRAMEKLIRRPASRIRGLTDAQLLPPGLVRQCARSDREALRQGRIVRRKEELSLPSGAVACYETIKAPIRDPQGRMIGLLGISRDVTADRRAAEALKDSEAKYRLLVESSLAGIYIATADGILRFANKMMGKISGWPVKKLIGRNLFEFIHPEDRKWVEGVFSKRIHGRKAPEQYRIRALHRDGSIRWLEIRATRVAYRGRPAVLGNFIDITDHVRAEAGLKESEERMRSLFEAAPFALFLETLTGSIVDCNRAAVDLLGYSREELLRMSARDLVPKKVADRFPDLITQEFTTGGFFVEGENIAKNGRIIPVEVSSRMIEIGGKKFIIVAIADITERKQAQSALAGERDRAQNYLDVAGVILIALNHRGEVVMINKKGCEVLGWKEKEIVGRNWFQSFLPPSARAETAAVFKKIVSGGLPPTEYHRTPLRTRFGEERLIAWHNTCLRDEGGKIIGTLSSGEDFTDRERIEEALRESEARNRTALQAMRDPIHVVDRDLTVILANSAFVEWNRSLGLETDMTGKKLKEVYPFLPPRVGEEYRKVFQAGQPLFSEERTRLGAREFATETAKIPIFEKGEVTRVITILRDVTERKQAEARLRDTSKLEAVGTMSLGLAHEFNNILMGISGYAQLALVTPADRERVEQALGTILRQTQRGKVLIQRLSTFGRRDKPLLDSVDLTRILEGVVSLQEREMKMGGVRVERSYDKPSSALADYSQMEQVFFNLIRNARQAIEPKRKGTITLSARNRGEEVEVRIADTGIGIRPDDLRRIFDPFFTTKERQKGDKVPSLGLGLWVSRQIVQEHGGKIAVESIPRKGTAFTIRLPRAPQPPAARVPAPGRPEEASAGVKVRRILVVDDEEDLLEVYRLYLAERFVTVTQARDGREAVRLCRKQLFDAILLDYVMPGLAGVALVKAIRRLCASARLYIISGKPIPREERKVLTPLVDGWLEKPMDLKKLQDVLKA